MRMPESSERGMHWRYSRLDRYSPHYYGILRLHPDARYNPAQKRDREHTLIRPFPQPSSRRRRDLRLLLASPRPCIVRAFSVAEEDLNKVLGRAFPFRPFWQRPVWAAPCVVCDS